MLRSKTLWFLLTLGLGAIVGLFIVWGPGGMLSPGPHSEDITVIIEKGSTLSQTAKLLAKDGVVKYPWIFAGCTVVSGNRGALKAGEYLIPARARPLDIVRIFVSGKVIVRQVTIPEGLTVTQVLEILKETPQLSGDIIHRPEEGTLLPETYSFIRGDSREKMISLMRQAMDQALEDVWKKHKEGSPIKTPEELLILASIVEKETSLAKERPRVAAVFLNRLKKGMKLQSDPTVIYGITLGEKALGHLLTLKELQHVSDYNTYLIEGLPPKPIACPGKASLEAVVTPLQTNEYYFVANGTGGHSFSSNYAGHAENVKEWRRVQSER